jgi:hypothetical protein
MEIRGFRASSLTGGNAMKSAIGASYCFDQSPGGERVGGLMVTLRRRANAAGTITIVPTERSTGEMEGAMLDSGTKEALLWFGKEAEEALRDEAKREGIDLNQFDIVLSDFIFHDVDSHSQCYAGAARSAFRSARDAWLRYYNPHD